VTRDEVGRIVIQERETRFEIAPYAAARFAANAAKPSREDAHILVEPERQGGAPRHASGPRGPGVKRGPKARRA
jgi:ATP-dependent RNA helicase DeaD